jgi:hypothetical protein
MKKTLLLILLFTSIFLTVNSKITGQGNDGVPFPKNKKIPEVKIYSSGKYEPYIVKAQNRKKAGEEPTAKFEVTYHNFSHDAQTAFAKAIENWSYLIRSNVTIKVDANWEALDAGILGSCSPNSFRRDFKNTPHKLTWYPIAIANKLAGYDIEPESYDITAHFSSSINWYLGTDGNCPSTQYDFVSVVMHEVGHGLGFIGSANVEGTEGSWGSGSNIPFIFDQFVYNGNDELLIDSLIYDNPSAELKTQYTSGNVFFHSELSDIATGTGKHARLYAPTIWNDGSSYSHLDDVYNNTENAMMTYSAGTGEVTHYPGSITLGMFAEMGWINLLFKHDRVKDMESMPTPIIIETEIVSDSLLVDGSVYLHYSIDNFATKTSLAMATSNDTLFTASIPVQATDTVKYYFEASTKLNRTYYYPVQKEPLSKPDTTFYFAIGLDNIAPVIEHEAPKSIFNFDENLELVVYSDDNQGISAINIEYKVNEGSIQTLACTLDGFSESKNLYRYKATIPVLSLADGDTLNYKIVAEDIATNPNSTVLPSEGFYKVAILDLGTPAQDFIINFDNESDKGLFYEQGLVITQPSGFTSKAIHSPHPYEEGDPYPNDEITYSIMLKTPVIIKDEDALMRFDEIVIVEKGEPGTSFGDNQFWDYVIVEASIDSGKTWHAFEDGYDCKISTTFTNAYNDESDGTESMYESNTINLLANPNIKGGDEALIRFRLWSDQGANGWGWAIDNLEIQGEVTSIKQQTTHYENVDVYPSPSNGKFEIKLSAPETISEFNIVIYNLMGEVIYKLSKKPSTKLIKQSVDISGKPNGVYLLKINYNNQVITKKIILR